MGSKSFGLILIGMILVQGLIAIILGHGLNGEYFRTSSSQAEALRKLRADKPKTATAIGICWMLCLADLLLAIVVKKVINL
jgi:hypothetical protein